jgi:hypothetical protein
VARRLSDVDRLAGFEHALLDDPQIGPGAPGQREQLHHQGIAELQAELEAGKPRLGDLEPDGADAPVLADLHCRQVEPRHGQVLAEGSGTELAPELRLPPGDVLARVGVDSLVGAAVERAVDLLVAVEVHATRRDRPGDRLLPDRGLDGAVAARDGPPAAHVDGDDVGGHGDIL